MGKVPHGGRSVRQILGANLKAVNHDTVPGFIFSVLIQQYGGILQDRQMGDMNFQSHISGMAGDIFNSPGQATPLHGWIFQCDDTYFF
jgi:hypothetical protein